MDNYTKLLIESKLFYPGSVKGTFCLLPKGNKIWEFIKNILDNEFEKKGIENVVFPTLISKKLFEKEKKHISGFEPEFFSIEEKKKSSIVLRPTSEVTFYNLLKKNIKSYKELPILYNQWGSVFRKELNISPFFRNTEFLWQEGHTIHNTKEEAINFTKNILNIYKNYAEKILLLAVLSGKKSEKEKFSGALESYTIECLLPDGQCLQLATSHYFGNFFCKAMGVNFRNEFNKLKNPYSTSWGTSTRAIGAIVKNHSDNLGLILPFDISPIQIAFIIIKKKKEIFDYYVNINSKISSFYRCCLYNKEKQNYFNIFQADKEGCPIKILIGEKELKGKFITLSRRNVKKKKEIFEENILKELIIEKNIFQEEVFFELLKKIKKGGLFLIPFCNNINCEMEIKNKIKSYSIRCINENKYKEMKKCIFCEKNTNHSAYLGRSY